MKPRTQALWKAAKRADRADRGWDGASSCEVHGEKYHADHRMSIVLVSTSFESRVAGAMGRSCGGYGALLGVGADGLAKPLLQGGQKMGADIAEGQTDAEMRMRVDDAGRSLEEVRLGKDFDEYERARGQRIEHVHVAAVDAELGDPGVYFGIGARVSDLGVGNKGKPGGLAALGRVPGVRGIGIGQMLAPKCFRFPARQEFRRRADGELRDAARVLHGALQFDAMLA